MSDLLRRCNNLLSFSVPVTSMNKVILSTYPQSIFLCRQCHVDNNNYNLNDEIPFKIFKNKSILTYINSTSVVILRSQSYSHKKVNQYYLLTDVISNYVFKNATALRFGKDVFLSWLSNGFRSTKNMHFFLCAIIFKKLYVPSYIPYGTHDILN